VKRLRLVLCALFGHPPAITQFMGYEYCARCEAQVGDQLASVGTGWPVVGHNCETCAARWSKARWHDRLLTPKVITGPIASCEQREAERRQKAADILMGVKR
jgi:hypothetical protein